MIAAHKEIQNIFGSSIYHKTYYIFESKSQEFHNSKIGRFGGNYTRMTGAFMQNAQKLVDAKSSSIYHLDYRI